MNQLLPYETIVKASEGDPEAVAAVLSHYAGYIRSCAKMDGQINTDMCGIPGTASMSITMVSAVASRRNTE